MAAEGRETVLSSHWADGGKGAALLAERVSDLLADESRAGQFAPLYADGASCREKIEVVAREIYRARNVVFTDEALKQMPQNDYPVCIAKTQYSFSDDATKLGFEKGSRGFVGPARLF